CVVVADRSSSMSGSPVAELNAGLKELHTCLVQDSLACLRVELALVSFSSAPTVDVDFTSPQNFTPPTLSAGGCTMMGAAVVKALELLDNRRAQYRSAGLAVYRPWLVLISDGCSTDDIAEAARRTREAEQRKRLAFFGIGVKGADMEELARFSLRPPLPLDGLKFAELFQWLSASLSSVAVSRPGDQVPLPPPNWSTL
ncbi:MAG: VWA domain-containing protein, partial [Verrucomicrobia bacterium]|nr:VWA domain-containing protein [Verrucomicrobiota bacterium]